MRIISEFNEKVDGLDEVAETAETKIVWPPYLFNLSASMYFLSLFLSV